jgi:hypothetical protein
MNPPPPQPPEPTWNEMMGVFGDTLQATAQREGAAGQATGPLVAPEVPQMQSFGDWMDETYPQIAGRRVHRSLLQHLHQQYVSEQHARGMNFQSEMDRYKAQIEAARFLTGTDQGPDVGKMMDLFMRGAGIDVQRKRLAAEGGPKPFTGSPENYLTYLLDQGFAPTSPEYQDARAALEHTRAPAKVPTLSTDQLLAKYVHEGDVQGIDRLIEGVAELAETKRRMGLDPEEAGRDLIKTLGPMLEKLAPFAQDEGSALNEAFDNAAKLLLDTLGGLSKKQTPISQMAEAMKQGFAMGAAPGLREALKSHLYRRYKSGELTREELAKELELLGGY